MSSVYDFVNTSESYQRAIPVLVSLLDPNMEPNVLEGVVGALTVKEARGVAGGPLLRLFRRLPRGYEGVKGAIVNAFQVVAEVSDFDGLAALAFDRGQDVVDRRWLTVALGRLDHPHRSAVLIRLLQDEEVADQAIEGLRRAKAVEARPRIKPFLKHRLPRIRQHAKKAIETLDREASRRGGRR